MRQLLYQVCYTRCQVSFCLWRLGPVLEHCEVPKYYDQDCSSVSQYFLKNNVKEFRVLAAVNREPSVGLQNPMFRTCYST